METKKWYIKQVINGKTMSNISFTATKEDYEFFKSLLFLPKSDEIVDYKIYEARFTIKDNETHIKKFFKIYMPLSKNEHDIFSLQGKTFCSIKVGTIYISLLRAIIPPNIIKQGREFEEYVSVYYQKQNYEVIKNYLKEKKDSGIDIIAKKDDELLLIQCKNWEKEIISHKEIKEFLGNCYLFLYKNLEYRKYKKVRRIYVISQSRLDKSAEYLFREYYPFVEYQKIKFTKK